MSQSRLIYWTQDNTIAWFGPPDELVFEPGDLLLFETGGAGHEYVPAHGYVHKRGGVDARVADAAVWLANEHLRNSRHEDRVVALARQAWTSGCRHLDLASDYAGRVAAAGRETNFTRALAVCAGAFSARDSSTATGWARLLSRRQRIAGRLQRLTSRLSSHFDEIGNPLAMRPHTATNPRRVRAQRFARP